MHGNVSKMLLVFSSIFYQDILIFNKSYICNKGPRCFWGQGAQRIGQMFEDVPTNYLSVFNECVRGMDINL